MREEQVAMWLPLLLLATLASGLDVPSVESGLDVLIASNFTLLPVGLRTGIISNPTGVASFHTPYPMQHGVDVLHFHSDVNVVAVFGPEHGFRGSAPPGQGGSSYVDPRTGLPVYAAYAMNSTELAQAFCDLALESILFDIQDVGVRFYTFIWTMYDAMIASTRCNTVRRFVVLDRPNPAGGMIVGGPASVDDGLASLVGRKPIALRHGLTIGELLELFASEFLPEDPAAAWPHSVSFERILMKGWRGRPAAGQQAREQWVAPSPNIPTPAAALVYVGFGLFEGTNLSIGRGTTQPFEFVGAPFVDYNLADALMRGRVPTSRVDYREAYFEPQSDVYAGHNCGGVQVMPRSSTDSGHAFDPLLEALVVLAEVRRLYPHDFAWRMVSGDRFWIDMLTGGNLTRLQLDAGASPAEIVQLWHSAAGLDDYIALRTQYLAY
mmetsp:Transcript_46494/g.122072  ORF Transcript_46494/g.122072 Transcript_46494/m.122072 type:complete len:437 (-) Transcript_46494:113-1423(-)